MVTLSDVAAARTLWTALRGCWRKRFPKSELILEIGRGPPFEITEPADASGHALRGFRVKITNRGTTDRKCLAKIVEMRRRDGAFFRNSYLPVALLTQHQQLQNRKGGEFNLRADESKLIEVVDLDEGKPNSEIIWRYEDPTYSNMVPRADYIIKLAVHGGGPGVEKFMRVYVDARGYLKLVGHN